MIRCYDCDISCQRKSFSYIMYNDSQVELSYDIVIVIILRTASHQRHIKKALDAEQ